MGVNSRNLMIKVAGGANVLDPAGRFNIGKRNYMVLRKLLWKNRLMINSESIGGSSHRSLKINIKTGQIMLKMPGGTFREM